MTEEGLERLNKGISQTIKDFRQHAGLSQKDLGTLVGINQSMVSRLEKADCISFSLSTLYQIFNKMNYDIEIRFIEKEHKAVDGV